MMKKKNVCFNKLKWKEWLKSNDSPHPSPHQRVTHSHKKGVMNWATKLKERKKRCDYVSIFKLSEWICMHGKKDKSGISFVAFSKLNTYPFVRTSCNLQPEAPIIFSHPPLPPPSSCFVFWMITIWNLQRNKHIELQFVMILYFYCCCCCSLGWMVCEYFFTTRGIPSKSNAIEKETSKQWQL